MKQRLNLSGPVAKSLLILLAAILLAVIFLAYQSPGLLLDFVNFGYCG